MKKIIYFSVFLLSFLFFYNCNSSKKIEIKKDKIEKVSKKINFDAYFKIIGTEPFWNIEIAEEKIVYTSIDGSKIEFPYNIPIINKTLDTRIYKTVNGNGTIEIKLTKGICSDRMSNKIYDFIADIELTQFKKTTKLHGCGFFIANETLYGEWYLNQLKSEKITADGNIVIPFIEFDFENNRFSGNAGCNGLSGIFSLKNDFIKFNEIFLTRVYCEDYSIERKFLNSLNVITTYRVEGETLKFYNNGLLELVFERKK